MSRKSDKRRGSSNGGGVSPNGRECRGVWQYVPPYRARKRNDGFEMVPREQSAAPELGTPHKPVRRWQNHHTNESKLRPAFFPATYGGKQNYRIQLTAVV